MRKDEVLKQGNNLHWGKIDVLDRETTSSEGRWRF